MMRRKKNVRVGCVVSSSHVKKDGVGIGEVVVIFGITEESNRHETDFLKNVITLSLTVSHKGW